jgi:EAL domain-containing protein (putative c-di-GMP-specific phosphodiesterase class I)
MYAAKSNGKNQCVYCSSEMKEDIIKNMKLANSLYRALDNNELLICYQPQVSTETQEIIGFEALLRWKHNEYGMVPPSVFIPIAEKTGLIKPIGLWVIKTACEQFKSFCNIENKEVRISINLSVEQLKDRNIARQISKILKDTKTDAKSIQIEITESVAFDREPYVLQRIMELKSLGISISIDDFGTGHSSISRLKAFPIDLIKIDMEFVRGISSESKKDKAIIKSIIQIAKNLGIKVMAEGVETEEQFNYLRKKKCDEIQGYYFYKPMTADEIRTIMAG